MAKPARSVTDARDRCGPAQHPNDLNRQRPPRIAYWIFNFHPQWEAASKELQTLSDVFGPVYGTRTISLNLDRRGTTLFGSNKHLPFGLALPALPVLVRAARAVAVNHVFASPGERLLTPWLARLDNTILTITKPIRKLRGVEKNIGALSRMRYVVVESEHHRELLLQLGLHADKIRIIYPGVDPEPYRPASGPFTIVFATSPKKRDELVTRGIYLMLAAAARLPSVRFRLIWRWRPKAVTELIRERGIGNVDVVAGYVEDMKDIYDSAHAVILPALEFDSFKPCPHSGLHSLAHGKPVLASRSCSLARIVDRHRCGVVFDPSVESLCAAIRHLAERYDDYQPNALPTLERKFSKDGFVDRYRQLYASLLDPQKAATA